MTTTGTRPTARPVAGSVDELLAGAERRQRMVKTAESLSGSPFERVVIGGRRRVVKYLSAEIDWIMRVTEDTVCRPVALWRAGVLDVLPPCLDHTIEGVSYDENTGEGAVLMRDVGPHFVDVTSGRIPLDQHRRFIEHMAQLHAAFWGLPDDLTGLCTHHARYTALGPAKAAAEVARGTTDRVVHHIGPGWAALATAAPDLHAYAAALATDPSPLGAVLDDTPRTLVHGDWKAGNLGSHPDGRTILVDWAWPGRSGGCVDLAWYLAVNCDLLPEPKEAAIEAYREALERRGIATRGWFGRQLEVALLGAFVQLGWSKAGQPAELTWWAGRVLPTARRLAGGS